VLIDGSRFQQFKHLHGETMLCGFARIHGSGIPCCVAATVRSETIRLRHIPIESKF
jgi:acetyl-CoA carboxylase carboxyltransferase component